MKKLKKVVSHLKDDIKTFKKEASDDKKLIKVLAVKTVKKGLKKKKKVAKVMREFKKSTLHSGSKKGPLVKNRKQAVAIAISEAKKVDKKKKK